MVFAMFFSNFVYNKMTSNYNNQKLKTMAKFAQYYLKYLRDDLFSDLEWPQRQRLLGEI